MPVKQRRRKARFLEHYRLWQLIEGPDASRQKGVGYLAPYSGRSFADLGLEEQIEVRCLMQADWAVHGREILDWWLTGQNLPDVPPWIFPMPGRPDRLPWAAQEFGVP